MPRNKDRIHVTLDKSMLARLDKFCLSKTLEVNRSFIVGHAVRCYLDLVAGKSVEDVGLLSFHRYVSTGEE